MKYSVNRILFICFVLGSCHESDDEQLKRELTIAETKILLASSKDSNNLISKVEREGSVYVIEFEDEKSYEIQSSLVEDITYDSSHWLVTITFFDETRQSAHFIGKLELTSNNISINPFLASPLTALAKIRTPVKGKFKVIVHGHDGGEDIKHTFDNLDEDHELQILGLYENYSNQVEFVFMNQHKEMRCSQVITLTTAEIPGLQQLDIQVQNHNPTQRSEALYFISNLKTAFDQAGAVRWHYDGDGSSFFGKLKNGNCIVAAGNNLSFSEITMLGQLVRKYPVPNGLHHEIIEMPSGNLLVASHSPPGHPYEDVVVEIDRETGKVIKSWDFNSILDPSRTALPDTQAGDWLHINAMYFDEEDNSIVISGRSQSAVVKIDYETSEIKWILGNPNFWKFDFQPFLLKPVDASGNEIVPVDFWNYGQHAISNLPNGNLLLYDNGDYRGFYDNANAAQNSYTRVVEYKINELLKTVQLVWQFDNNKSVFTKYTGFVQNLPETNTRLVAFMWITENTPQIIEVDQYGQIVFEAKINPGKSSYYRAMKIDLYEAMD